MAKIPARQAAHLVLGGTRSGKTAYALSLADGLHLEKWMVATAHAGDDEMQERIERHRDERDASWRVIEEQIDIVEVLRTRSGPERILVVDCLTLWLSNLLVAKRDLAHEIIRLANAVLELSGPVLFVSNEIGLGLVPNSELTRTFRDMQGTLNQKLAGVCGTVTFVVAGLPIVLKCAAGS